MIWKLLKMPVRQIDKKIEREEGEEEEERI